MVFCLLVCKSYNLFSASNSQQALALSMSSWSGISVVPGFKSCGGW